VKGAEVKIRNGERGFRIVMELGADQVGKVVVGG